MKSKKSLATLVGLVLLFSVITCAFAACGKNAELVDVQLLYYADKDTYIVGETFDATGLDITAVYSDGSRKKITDYKIDKTGALTLEDTFVTITYGDYVFEHPITVCIPGDVIVLQFAQGVDGITLYADGGVYVARVATATPKTRTDGATWSWDGNELEILIELGTSACQPKNYVMKDGKQKMILERDAQNNLTANYVYIRWTISAVCPYRVWSVALEGKTFPIAQN